METTAKVTMERKKSETKTVETTMMTEMIWHMSKNNKTMKKMIGHLEEDNILIVEVIIVVPLHQGEEILYRLAILIDNSVEYVMYVKGILSLLKQELKFMSTRKIKNHYLRRLNSVNNTVKIIIIWIRQMLDLRNYQRSQSSMLLL